LKSIDQQQNFNGGVLVAKGESIIYEEYKGYKNMQTKEPLDATSPCILPQPQRILLPPLF
jgi:hypothetical protein